MVELFANSGDPDQTSELGLHCLPITLSRVSRLQCCYKGLVKEKYLGYNCGIIFLISPWKHKLWVLIRIAWLRRFLWVPTTYVFMENLRKLSHNYLQILPINKSSVVMPLIWRYWALLNSFSIEFLCCVLSIDGTRFFALRCWICACLDPFLWWNVSRNWILIKLRQKVALLWDNRSSYGGIFGDNSGIILSNSPLKHTLWALFRNSSPRPFWWLLTKYILWKKKTNSQNCHQIYSSTALMWGGCG